MTEPKLKRPAFQFYPADWRKDAALQSCSIGARGFWVEIMCIAHECEPYGHLTVNGKPMSAAQLARLVGITPKEAERFLAELDEAGVTSRSEEGALFSRRMVRDEASREARADIGRANGAKGAAFGKLGAEHGKKGGRPKGDNPPTEPGKKPPQNPHPSSSSSSSSSEQEIWKTSSSSSARPTIPCPYQEIVNRYHAALPELPKVKLMPDDRQRALRKRWAWVLSSSKPDGTRRATTADEGLAWFASYFARVRDNDFLMGRGERSGEHANWQCDLDFLLTDKGMRHVIEKTRAAA